MAGRPGIQLERILALRHQVGIVAEQRPVAGIHGGLLLLHAVGHVVAVRDAVAVGDDQRRPVVRLRFWNAFTVCMSLAPIAILAT